MKHAKAGVVQLLTYTETGLRNTIYKNSRAKNTKYHVKFENNTIWTEICTRIKMNCMKNLKWEIQKTLVQSYTKTGKKPFIKIPGQKIQNRIVQNILVKNDVKNSKRKDAKRVVRSQNLVTSDKKLQGGKRGWRSCKVFGHDAGISRRSPYRT